MRVQIQVRIVSDDDTVLSDDVIACFDKGDDRPRPKSDGRRSSSHPAPSPPHQPRRAEPPNTHVPTPRSRGATRSGNRSPAPGGSRFPRRFLGRGREASKMLQHLPEKLSGLPLRRRHQQHQAPIPFSDIYEALYRGSWRSERTAIEKNVLEVAQAELASTASERCRCDPLKPEFNPFCFQPAPPLPRPHLHKMLLNGIASSP
jgi:hypothetical protein